jgi:alcohol dehydrogenase
MTPGFTNHLPVRVEFGAGTLARLPEILAAEGCSTVFVVADPVVLALAPVVAVLDVVRRTATVVVHPVPAGEPTIESVDAAGAHLREAAADIVVALGGGSALDTGKGARLLLENAGSIRAYTWPGTPAPIAAPRIPLVTIPTTAGTGSEVTGGVVMTDEAAHAKVAAPSPHNRAQHCLVDPELTVSLPAGPTMWGGLDALGQAIGSVIACVHTPVGDGMALEAIRLVTQALPRVLADPSDLDARSDVACAALLAGLAMNVSEAGTEHSLAHALGALHHLPHGLTVGLVLAESMEHDRRYEPARFERVADAMGAPVDGTADGSRAVAAVHRLLAEVGCPTLTDSGVTADDVEALTACALAGWIPVEPGPWSIEDVRAAYGRALAIHSRTVAPWRR